MAEEEKTTIEELRADPNLDRRIDQELLVLEVTEAICKTMAARGIDSAELARRLGKTQAYVDRFLEGQGVISLRRVSDFMRAMNASLDVSVLLN